MRSTRRYRGSWREEEQSRACEEFSGAARRFTKRGTMIGRFGNGSGAWIVKQDQRHHTSPPTDDDTLPSTPIGSRCTNDGFPASVSARSATGGRPQLQDSARRAHGAAEVRARDSITSCSPHRHASKGHVQLTQYQTRNLPDHRKDQPGGRGRDPCEATP